ncbi:MAG: hypothetical protein PWR04_1199 [Anaerophaga sp.]|nr:hypothetical protein [Anaerophaga sp.]
MTQSCYYEKIVICVIDCINNESSDICIGECGINLLLVVKRLNIKMPYMMII